MSSDATATADDAPSPSPSPAPSPAQLLAVVAAAHRRFEQTIAGLDDVAARSPSDLPGWSVGHVITHVARNADAFAWLTANAVAGRVANQYPGGQHQRDVDIDNGASRPADVLIADVIGAHARLEALWTLAPEPLWENGLGRSGAGHTTSMYEWAARRLRETEVHRTDLALDGLSWRDWPDEFVDTSLGAGPALGPRGLLAPFMAASFATPLAGPADLVATDRPGRWTYRPDRTDGNDRTDGAAPAVEPRIVRADRRTLLALVLGRTELS